MRSVSQCTTPWADAARGRVVAAARYGDQPLLPAKDRLDFVAGDFFRDDLPEGYLIALGYVLSNWPHPECAELLRKAHEACSPGGKVLVLERLFDGDRDGPSQQRS